MRLALWFAFVGVTSVLPSPRRVQAQGFLAQCANAPMSARFEIIRVRTLANGTTITDHEAAFVARDSKGRVFWQRIQLEAGAAVGHSTALASVSDPVSGESFQLQPETRTANVVSNTPIPLERIGTCQNAGPPQPQPERPGEEQLGTRVIEGLTVEGTRTVTTIPDGAVGNDKAIVVTKERWFSTELNLEVKGRDDDPRLGVATFGYTNIQRGEPDQSHFRIPDGFVVTAREQIQVAY